MTLSYQPFAEIPEVDTLAQELHMNMSNVERTTSGTLGAALLAGAGPAPSRSARYLLVLGGLALIYRAWTGRCPWYKLRGIDRRHEKAGVRNHRGIKVEDEIEIHRAPELLYDFWHNLEHLPKIMRHVKSVQRLSARRSHWEVGGPLGQTVEWEAEIINDVPGKLIAWQSLPGARVRNAGSVRFEPTDNGGTMLRVSFVVDPPAGAVGATISAMLGRSPQRDLSEDLAAFKEFTERELAPFGA